MPWRVKRAWLPSLLVVAALGAAVVLALRATTAPTAVAMPPQSSAEEEESSDEEPSTLPLAPAAAGDLPPGHPPIGPAGNDLDPAATDEPAALRWKAPAAWEKVPNPNAMRLATYKVPRASGDAADAELAVSRAGGDTKANVNRWIAQFEPPRGGEPRTFATTERQEEMVRGLRVTKVHVSGTYLGGMGPDSAKRDGWALLGAIVETKGQPYFFKLTGPEKTVSAAQAAFNAMIGGVTPGE
jgi:hypothetical protein